MAATSIPTDSDPDPSSSYESAFRMQANHGESLESMHQRLGTTVDAVLARVAGYARRGSEDHVHNGPADA